MLIDTHSHLNFDNFFGDGEEVARDSLRENIWIINIGTNCADSRRALELAETFEEGVYSSVGLHPGAVLEDRNEVSPDISSCGDIVDSAKVVAIGETGLDYHYLNGLGADEWESLRREQIELLGSNLAFARENKKPLIIHCRDAYSDLLDVIKDSEVMDWEEKGVIHCFTGAPEEAKQMMDLGFYIGFTGIITFGNRLDEVIREVPLNRILIETDAPFLAPHPHRGERNYPQYVKYVADKIAEVKQIRVEEVADQTTENARELFNI